MTQNSLSPAKSTAKAGRRQRIVVALSGSGRTLENLCLHQRSPTAAYELCGVITSSLACRGYELARAAGLPTYHGPLMSAPGTASPQLDAWLQTLTVDWIALAGFLKVFPTVFPGSANLGPERIINIHPSLLPHFAGKNMYGMRVHRAVLEARVSESGASIHFVTPAYDEGPIIAQVRVPVLAADDEEALAARVFAAESALYPHVLSQLCRGRLPLATGAIVHYTFINNTLVPCTPVTCEPTSYDQHHHYHHPADATRHPRSQRGPHQGQLPE